jgi:hypothetical protein
LLAFSFTTLQVLDAPLALFGGLLYLALLLLFKLLTFSLLPFIALSLPLRVSRKLLRWRSGLDNIVTMCQPP